jgi:hypothetical protein
MHNDHASPTYFDGVGIEVLTAVVMKCSIFWDITLCSQLKVNRRFGEICHFHVQGQKVGQARNQLKADSKNSYYTLVCCLANSFTLKMDVT